MKYRKKVLSINPLNLVKFNLFEDELVIKSQIEDNIKKLRETNKIYKKFLTLIWDKYDLIDAEREFLHTEKMQTVSIAVLKLIEELAKTVDNVDNTIYFNKFIKEYKKFIKMTRQHKNILQIIIDISRLENDNNYKLLFIPSLKGLDLPNEVKEDIFMILELEDSFN